MRCKPRRIYGFSLIELSIVLVIIGLIAGGILVGRQLIEGAKMRAVMREKEELSTAFNTFRLKYNCLAGDCPWATNFFGSAGGDGTLTTNTACANAATAGLGSTGTCNGNGNKRIAVSGDGGVSGEGSGRFLIWQHLALAGYLEGAFAATGAGISYSHRAGYNVPQSSYSETSAWVTMRADTASAALTSTNFPRNLGPDVVGKNPLLLVKTEQNAGGWWNWPRPIFRVTQMRELDNKYDDGMPYTGNIQAGRDINLGPCTNTDTVNVTEIYLTTNPSSPRCVAVFLPGL